MRGPVVMVMVAALVGGGCAHRLKRTLVEPARAETLDGDSPVLKAHMRNGDLVILDRWTVATGEVLGTGERFDMDRRRIGKGALRVNLAEVALFETNVQATAPQVAGLAVVFVLSGALTVACLANPKACFGSCPTFYVDDGGPDVVEAEGFSASITPALEATDVDALWAARPPGRRVSLRVTNEALETHVIRRAELLAAERPPGGRVVADRDGRPWRVVDLTPPSACTAAEGDCRAAVAGWDDRERWSGVDGRDLAARETIELEFPPGEGERALVVGFRQTFLSTFLLYQALAYLGRDAVATLARVERGDPELARRANALVHLLGGIEVQVRDGEDWRTIGELDETGPIASDVQLVRLPAGTDGRRLRLRLTRGHWRLGMLALGRVDGPAQVTRLAPRELRTAGRPDARALAGLRGDAPLITTPGDEHELTYELPGDPADTELLLSSRGYYLEWMRKEWLADENPLAAWMLLETPELALRLLAPRFKAMEPEMESLFWRSRYAPR